MKRTLLLLFITILFFIDPVFSQQTNFFSYKVKNIVGDSINLSIFKGKKILVVNTASYCGYTPQYADLQQLYESYKDKGLVIIGFPSNDFAGQEPGADTEILEFCQNNYHVTFPMMSKIHVTGTDIHALFKWLTQKSLNGVKDAPVTWNFQKFLINEDGTLYDVLSPQANPLAPKITSWLDKGVGIPAVDVQNVFTVYPSPAKQNFTILVNMVTSAFVRLRIFDSKGALVEELYNEPLEGELRIEYFTDKMQDGIYIINLEVDGVKQTQQITINKD